MDDPSSKTAPIGPILRLWSHPVGLLRLSMAAAIVFPFALVGGVAWQTHEAAVAGINQEARRAVATTAEHMLKVLETHGIALDLADEATLGLSCEAVRASATLPALLARLSAPSPDAAAVREINTIWVIGPTGLACGVPAGYKDDGKSRADRDYFAGARDADGTSTFVGRPSIGRIGGGAFFSLARRRSAPAGGFTGVVISSVDTRYLTQTWQAMAPPSSGHRITLYRSDGVVLAPAVPEAAPDTAAERRIAARWATAPEGTAMVAPAAKSEGEVLAWRVLPAWGVVITDTLNPAAALNTWRRTVFLYLLVAALASAALVSFALGVLHAIRRTEAATRQTETEIGQRRQVEATLREAQQSDQEKQRLNRALRLLSDCNLALVRAQNEEMLLADVCRLMVETGGYLMAWVGFAENDAGKSVRPVAQAGFEDGYLERIQVSWDETLEIGRGPAGTAVRSRKTQAIANYLTVPSFAPWRDAAIKRGYRSSIGLPLIVYGQAIGVLSLYAAEPDAFSAEEAALLEELTTNLAFGIETLRTRSQITATQAKLEHLVTVLAEAEQSARASEAQYRALAEHSTDAIVRTGLDGIRRYMSPSTFRLTGYRPEELVGKHWTAILHPDDRPIVEDVLDRLRSGAPRVTATYRALHKDGSVFWIEAQSSLVCDPATGAPEEIVTVARDITAHKDTEEALLAITQNLTRLAETDALTGLANRRRFDDVLDQEWRRARREPQPQPQPLSLLLLDVDCFKLYNDHYGHPMGDQALRSVARCIQGNIRRPGDVAARYGGEEFAVILPNTLRDGAVQVAEAIRNAVAALRLPHQRAPSGIVTVSIGAASVIATPEATMASLIAGSDQALYAAKAGGRNQTRHAEATAETARSDGRTVTGLHLGHRRGGGLV